MAKMRDVLYVYAGARSSNLSCMYGVPLLEEVQSVACVSQFINQYGASCETTASSEGAADVPLAPPTRCCSSRASGCSPFAFLGIDLEAVLCKGNIDFLPPYLSASQAPLERVAPNIEAKNAPRKESMLGTSNSNVI